MNLYLRSVARIYKSAMKKMKRIRKLRRILAYTSTVSRCAIRPAVPASLTVNAQTQIQITTIGTFNVERNAGNWGLTIDEKILQLWSLHSGSPSRQRARYLMLAVARNLMCQTATDRAGRMLAFHDHAKNSHRRSRFSFPAPLCHAPINNFPSSNTS